MTANAVNDVIKTRRLQRDTTMTLNWIAGRLADPLMIVDAQRRELLRLLRDAQRAAMAEPDGSAAGLLLEGVALRLQADLRWLEACEQHWTIRGNG